MNFVVGQELLSELPNGTFPLKRGNGDAILKIVLRLPQIAWRIPVQRRILCYCLRRPNGNAGDGRRIELDTTSKLEDRIQGGVHGTLCRIPLQANLGGFPDLAEILCEMTPIKNPPDDVP